MADDNPDDDIYDDPETIGELDDDVDGAAELPSYVNPEDPSESIYTPEENTTPLDDRGPIDELEAADATSERELEGRDLTVDDALLDEDPSTYDPDDYRQRQDVPQDEKDQSFDNE